MDFQTTALCDDHAQHHGLTIAEPILRSFGGKTRCAGPITTVKVFEDNVLIERILSETQPGGILVVDGGGSHRCALIDGALAQRAADHGWQGLVVYGCIRDTVALSRIPLAVFALHAHPLRAHARGTGERDVLITFASVNFRTGHHLYADEDGIVVAETALV